MPRKRNLSLDANRPIEKYSIMEQLDEKTLSSLCCDADAHDNAIPLKKKQHQKKQESCGVADGVTDSSFFPFVLPTRSVFVLRSYNYLPI
jgi:hypothetical protein